MGNMNITVILCTFNRCQSLAETLESIAASKLPDGVEWEVLVVDNNSTDRTREVVENFCRRYSDHFHYIAESNPGKSFALNTGIREARGDVLAFVDDDVTVDPNWLHSLTAALKDKEWAGVGGRTVPTEALPIPPWLSPDLTGALCAHFDLGDVPCELDRAPYGVNMAFRKEMFEKYGLFRIDLGPSPDPEIPRPNEDTEFGRRLMSAGERLRYEPSALVRHPVPKERLRKGYFLAWWFDLGRASMREVGRRRDVLGIPRHYLSMLKYGLVLMPTRTLRWVLALTPQSRFYRKCRVWKTMGEIAEIYGRSFGAKKMRNNVVHKSNGDCSSGEMDQ
jgi:glycosyltransferase involved in cell wall biosynthesis